MTTRRVRQAIFLFLAVLFVGGFAALRVLPRNGVRQRLDAIRAAGLPASAAELNKWYGSVPTNQNRAILLEEAIRLKVDASADLEAKLNADFTPELKTELRAYLEENEPALRAVHAAVLLPKSRFPVDMSLGFSASLPHLAGVKGLAQLLKHEAVYKARQQDGPGAFQALESGLAIAGTMRSEPFLISELVGIACASITLNTLERVLNEIPLTEIQLARLSSILASAETDGMNDLYRSMVSERAAGVSAFELSFHQLEAMGGGGPGGSPPGWLSVLGYQAYRLTGLRERDLLMYLDAMQLLMNASQSRFPEALRQATEARDEIQRRQSTGLGRLAVLSRMVLPSLQNAVEKEAGLVARLRCAMVALALERYRLENGGHLPETLAGLSPKYLHIIPVDPFDGNPLTYEKLSPSGYRVISLKARAGRRKDAPDVGMNIRR